MEILNETRPSAIIQSSDVSSPSPQKKYSFFIFSIILFIMGILFVRYYILPPDTERIDIIVNVPEGASVRLIATLLQNKKIIRSDYVFIALAKLRNIETKLPSGIFQFAMPMDVFSVMNQMSNSDHGIAEVKITIPEGTSNKQMSDLFSKHFPNITRDEFLRTAKDKEGYLFPDTYFLYINATSGPVVTLLSENFLKKTKELYSVTLSKNIQWNDVIIMASIIEEEAVSREDRKIISGILWNRIKRGMPLQVDASFMYLMGKASSEITLEDLKIDSPYNTYQYKGLPSGPITNPGRESIEAALYPSQTDYFYYLSDKNGIMHYAKTFQEHKFNKARYLR